MISGKDAYEVMAAMVPLYVAMFLAYGSVRWWGIFTPVQCSGINRFVAMFAVPVLSFHIIGTSNMYTMNYTFIAADTLQKVAVLVFLAAWSYAGRLLNRGPRIGIEWGITLFSLSTLPNTLIIGIPLLKAMYGESAGNLMVQVIVFQGVVWYNVLLVLFECRAAKILISEQFPRGEAEKIASVRVDSDVASLGGLEPLETEAETDREGRLHVRVRRSYGSASSMNSFRISNLSGVEIYSVQSMSPTRVPSFNYGSGRHETVVNGSAVMPVFIRSSSEGLGPVSLGSKHYEIPMALAGSLMASSERCPPKPPSVNGPVASGEFGAIERYSSSVRFDLRPERHAAKGTKNYLIEKSDERSENGGSARRSSESVKITNGGDGDGDYECGAQEITDEHRQMPAASVMAKLIFVMVWRKLTRNPNTYASFLGVVWSLVSNRWHVEFPSIIENSIQIISDTGLGMAVFSLGLFMALQPKIISCGKKAAATSMGMKFLVGPTLMAATSLAIGIRGTLLHVAIIQAALPQGIVPFVFAKEYDVHADILSTSVIFGMMIALPITIIYNIFLEL